MPCIPRSRRLLTTFIAFFIITTGNGQSKATDSLRDKEILSLQSSLDSLRKEIRTQEGLQNASIDLQDKISQAANTISNQSALIDGFGVMYTIITIIIALIGIVLPILTYQFGIKPSQEALKEFEKNADLKFQDYLQKSRDSQIKQAIKNLSSNNPELKSNAVLFISGTSYEGFTEEQLFLIFAALKSERIDNATKMNLSYTLSTKKSLYAYEYYTDVIAREDDINIRFSATYYLARFDVESNLKWFRLALKRADDKYIEATLILTYSSQVNKDAPMVLLNDKEFVDSLDHTALDNFSESIKQDQWGLNADELKSTYLSQKINESKKVLNS